MESAELSTRFYKKKQPLGKVESSRFDGNEIITIQPSTIETFAPFSKHSKLRKFDYRTGKFSRKLQNYIQDNLKRKCEVVGDTSTA